MIAVIVPLAALDANGPCRHWLSSVFSPTIKLLFVGKLNCEQSWNNCIHWHRNDWSPRQFCTHFFGMRSRGIIRAIFCRTTATLYRAIELQTPLLHPPHPTPPHPSPPTDPRQLWACSTHIVSAIYKRVDRTVSPVDDNRSILQCRPITAAVEDGGGGTRNGKKASTRAYRERGSRRCTLAEQCHHRAHVTG